MRLFIAIDIDDEVKNALSNLQKQVQNQVDIRKNDVKWVNPENIHLTLKFLGEVKDDKVPGLCNIIKDVAGQFENFDLEIQQLGYFGGKSARVLWIGTGTGSDTGISANGHAVPAQPVGRGTYFTGLAHTKAGTGG